MRTVRQGVRARADRRAAWLLLLLVDCAGCARPDMIQIPRVDAAYTLGRLEVRLGDACAAGRIDALTCQDLRDLRIQLTHLILSPPAPGADVAALLEFLAAGVAGFAEQGPP